MQFREHGLFFCPFLTTIPPKGLLLLNFETFVNIIRQLNYMRKKRGLSLLVPL